jgi:CDP-diacylglycerol--serine O-phosphatidyltransferase
VILVVLIFGMVTIDPPRVLLGAFLLYAISGPIVRVVRGKAASKPAAD